MLVATAAATIITAIDLIAVAPCKQIHTDVPDPPELSEHPAALPRPVRLFVVPRLRKLAHILAVASHREHLCLARPRGREDDMAAVGRERRAFVASLAERQLPPHVGRQIEHFDVEARTGAR